MTPFLLAAVSAFCIDKQYCLEGQQVGDAFEFTVYSSLGGWAAFGVGHSMTDAQIYYGFQVGNKTTVVSSWSKGHGRPQPLEIVENLQVGSAPDWAKLAFRFKRPASGNYSQLTQDSVFIYAHSSKAPTNDGPLLSAKIAFHGPNFGVIDRLIEREAQPILQPTFNQHFWHGLVMFLAWAVAPVLGIFTSRHLKHSKAWFKLHVSFFVFTLAATVAGFLLVYLFKTPEHFDNLHAKVGLSVIIMMTLQILLGIYIDQTYVHSRTETPLRDKIHWFTGRATFLMGLIAVLMGFQRYEKIGHIVDPLVYALYLGWIAVADAFVVYGVSKAAGYHPVPSEEPSNA
ncbi:hypothetical protein EDD86DRAFT_210179 [Gorgonomyces haynaldii]|nr:hypothetical protein EDD86DRAFT_210179 [Gorgonomyces haynaldii]